AGATAGSDNFSTNLLAYTATVGNGLSATISIEDPVFRRTPIFSPFNVGATVSSGSVSNFGVTNQPTPV
ncbi:porin, partial [Methylobacterium sp. J-026]|nr:porin [Methylobacterium sp. J-026]